MDKRVVFRIIPVQITGIGPVDIQFDKNKKVFSIANDFELPEVVLELSCGAAHQFFDHFVRLYRGVLVICQFTAYKAVSDRIVVDIGFKTVIIGSIDFNRITFKVRAIAVVSAAVNRNILFSAAVVIREGNHRNS